MIILFLLSLTLLKMTGFDPFDLSPKALFPNILFWFASVGAILLLVSAFWPWFRLKLANEAIVFSIMYLAAYTLNWQTMISVASPIIAGNTWIECYIIIAGFIYLLALTFFLYIHMSYSKPSQYFGFGAFVGASIILFWQQNYLGGIIISLFSILLLLVVLEIIKLPDYYPVSF